MAFTSLTTTHLTHPSEFAAVLTFMFVAMRYILLGLDNGTISILDLEGGNERILKASEGAIWECDVWEDEDEGEGLVFVGGTDRMVGVFELESLQEKIRLEGHTSTVRFVKALSATSVLSASRDATMRAWDVETGQCKTVFEGHTATIRAVAVHGDLVVSGSYDHDARVWSLEKKTCLHILKGHESKIYSIAFDGKRIVTGSLDKTVRIWDPTSGTCQAVLQGHSSLVSLLQLQPSVLISADAGGEIRHWSLGDYRELRVIKVHQYAVTTMQCYGGLILSGGSDGNVKVWNFATGELKEELVSSDAVWKVAFLGERIAAAFSRNNQVVLQIWETRDLEGV